MTSNYKQPETFLVGQTVINYDGIRDYLEYTNQEDFLDNLLDDKELSDGEKLCSFYAKLCYASLVEGKNKNITKTRKIYDNIIATIESGHGSVFEHCLLNFVTTDCSRVYTHELVRHRVGTAFSQTSGRYVRSDELNIVIDPILQQLVDNGMIEQARLFLERWYNDCVALLGLNNMKDFTQKKKLTSALRRMMPNGQANEIGFSVNLRTLRHTIELRTSRHAEWEIRKIFNQVYFLVFDKYPAIFADVHMEEIEGAYEITFKNKKI